MIMKCKEVQKIICSTKSGEVSSAQEELINAHIVNCHECKEVLEKVHRADEILVGIKKQIPILENEEELTKSIMAEISGEKPSDSDNRINNFFDYLDELVSIKAVRFALTVVLLLCVLSYTCMEFFDAKEIANLEHKIDKRFDKNSNYAGMLQQETNIVNFLSDVYKLTSGKTSYLELNKDWVLMKKGDLQALFNDYDRLDAATKLRLNEIKNHLPELAQNRISPSMNNNEINSLRKEVERLNKELEKVKSQRGMR